MTNQVENFIVQYEQESLAQEVNANKRILNAFVWVLAAIALLWVGAVTGLLEVNRLMVTVAFLLSFILYLPTFYLIHRGQLSKGWIKYFLLAMLCIICGVIMSVLTYHTTLLTVFPLLYAILYRDKKVIRYTCIISLVTTSLSILIGFYFGICDLNLLLQGHHSRSWYLNSAIADTLIFPLNETPVFSILLHVVLPRALMLLLLSIILQFTVISNTRDALRIAQLTYHKDTDSFTEVFNKNKYEEMITKYYPAVDRLAVIFFDLNNLKKINDEQGHAMGDYVIKSLASIVHTQANDQRRVYRIGGDEFVMVLENPADSEAEEIIAYTRTQLDSHNQSGPVEISSAMGFAYGKGSDVLEVVKAADEKMYENKRQIKGL